MSSVAATALSGLQAAMLGMDAAANNVANQETPGYRREQVVASTAPSRGVQASLRTAAAPGAEPERDVVEMLSARNAFLANLAVFRSASATSASLLSAFA